MTAPYDDSRLASVLRLYADDPLDDGDAVLLVDDVLCVEVTGLADQWDDALCVSTGRALATASRVCVAIARPGAELRPADHQLWRDLHADLRGRHVELLPVRALPAA